MSAVGGQALADRGWTEQDVQTNGPMAVLKYYSDPDAMQIFSKITSLLGLPADFAQASQGLASSTATAANRPMASGRSVAAVLLAGVALRCSRCELVASPLLPSCRSLDPVCSRVPASCAPRVVASA